MTQANRGRVVWAILLIAAGLYLFALQFFPDLRVFAINQDNWPLILVGIGAILLVAALLTRTPGLMVPACVVGGLGVLMFWQNATNNWSSWAYAWTLIPGFVGVGIVLMNVMQGSLRQGLVAGGALIGFSVVGFLIFGAFFGGLGNLGLYWPLILIVVGIFVLAQAFIRR